jgi:DNA anti-recombination protein RmuC
MSTTTAKTQQYKRKRKRITAKKQHTNENENKDSTSSKEIENLARRSRRPTAARASVDDEEIPNILDSMVDGLGLSNQVNRGIEDIHRHQEAAQRQTRLAHVDETAGNAVMMAQNANRGFGTSSRDAN